MTFADALLAAIEKVDFGKATARRGGRDNRWPYVPIIDHSARESAKVGVPLTRTEQIRGKAFATRDEAIEYARWCLIARRELLTKHLAEPRYRALRESHGLPREIPEQEGAQ